MSSGEWEVAGKLPRECESDGARLKRTAGGAGGEQEREEEEEARGHVYKGF